MYSDATRAAWAEAAGYGRQRWAQSSHTRRQSFQNVHRGRKGVVPDIRSAGGRAFTARQQTLSNARCSTSRQSTAPSPASTASIKFAWSIKKKKPRL